MPVLVVSPRLIWNISLLRKIERDIVINAAGFHAKYLLFLSSFE
jgi:hypothetical protein